MAPLKAVLIGGTGETGRILVRYLAKSESFGRITLISRSSKDKNFFRLEDSQFSKIRQVECGDFAELASQKSAIEDNDVAFSTMGTTTGKSDAEQYRRIEMYAANFAGLCKESGVRGFYFISSAGANSSSMFGYLKLKGEVENAIKDAGVPHIGCFRPGLILGIDRAHRSMWEKPMAVVSNWTDCLLPKDSQALHLTRIARAMLMVAERDASKPEGSGFGVYTVQDIKDLTPDMTNFPAGWEKYGTELPL